ncbi:MAG TPA: hypothetical protein VM597_38245, partial [Gemmataceae bacterium]|nr:hypothetical protein [Gemmataceae bacterium]
LVASGPAGTTFAAVAGPNFRIDRGATMRIVDPRPVPANSFPCEPANPGPQPGFNYRAPRYAPVVRYAEQVQ